MIVGSKTLLVDSGFFFALFNPRDRYHADACEKQDWLEILSIVIPWPILYETINTRFVRRPETVARIALRLAQVLGMSADFWLDLQSDWDLWQAMQTEKAEEIAQLEPLPDLICSK